MFLLILASLRPFWNRHPLHDVATTPSMLELLLLQSDVAFHWSIFRTRTTVNAINTSRNLAMSGTPAEQGREVELSMGCTDCKHASPLRCDGHYRKEDSTYTDFSGPVPLLALSPESVTYVGQTSSTIQMFTPHVRFNSISFVSQLFFHIHVAQESTICGSVRTL